MYIRLEKKNNNNNNIQTKYEEQYECVCHKWWIRTLINLCVCWTRSIISLFFHNDYKFSLHHTMIQWQMDNGYRRYEKKICSTVESKIGNKRWDKLVESVNRKSHRNTLREIQTQSHYCFELNVTMYRSFLATECATHVLDWLSFSCFKKRVRARVGVKWNVCFPPESQFHNDFDELIS